MLEILLAIVVLVILPILLHIINRNILKPKKFPPGPLILPVVGSVYALGNEAHKSLSALKSKYGNIISIYFGSYRGIVLNDFDTIRKCLSLREFQNRPTFELMAAFRGEHRTGILWSSGKTSDEQRAFMLKALKNFGMGKKRMEILVQEQLKKLFDVLDQQSGKALINHDLFNITAIGALWNIVSGESVEEADDDLQTILKLTKKVSGGFNPITYFLPRLAKLFPNASGWNQVVQSALQQNEFIAKTVESHREFLTSEDEEPRDVIEAFLRKLKATEDINSTFYGDIGEKNMLSSLGDMFQAGTETVSTTLTWLVSILIRHPEKQDKIQKEIDKVIGKKRLPTLNDRQELPYIEAVLYEILRYSGLVQLGVPHESSEDVEIDGYFIPKNTIVIANSYDALHDPNHWDEPEIFNPERFLSQDGSELLRNITKKADIIFGHGRRICHGEAIAKDELFLLITGLCQRYNFQKDPAIHYDSDIKVNISTTLIPKPHSFIVYKRF